MRYLLAAILVLCASVATAQPRQEDAFVTAPPALFTNMQLSSDGLGDIRVGTPIGDVEALLGIHLEPRWNDTQCDEYRIDVGAGGVSILTRQRRVSRVSVVGEDFGVATASGISLGDTGAQVRAAYGSGVIRRRAVYDDPPAYDLIAWSARSRAGIRFEFGADGRLVRMHGGDDSVEYVEGCL